MPVKAVILVLLVLGGGVALWQSRAGAPGAASAVSAASASMAGARSCLEASPGFQVRESDEAKGVRQLLVTTPSGSSSRSGNVTINHEATVFVTFFESPEQAERVVERARGDLRTDGRRRRRERADRDGVPGLERRSARV